jgi:hypothetical protein
MGQLIEYPPSTGIAAPVTKSEALLARNTASPARSAGTPHLPAGVLASTRSFSPATCSRAPCVSSVSIHPGSTAFAWISSTAQAVAMDLVNCTIPPLLAP